MDKERLIQGIVESLAKCQRPTMKHSWQSTGISHAQAGVLYLLFYHQPVSAKEIASFLGISKGAVSQLVDPLLDKGFINRQIDVKDRRIARFSLTAKGKNELKALSKHKFAGLRSSLEALDHKELETLYKLHKKLAEHVSLERGQNDQ